MGVPVPSTPLLFLLLLTHSHVSSCLSCPGAYPYLVLDNNTYSCRTPKSNNYLHVAQCLDVNHINNISTQIRLDNNHISTSACGNYVEAQEVLVFDVSWTSAVIISQFCPSIYWSSNVITRFAALDFDQDLNPCAGDDQRKPSLVSGEPPTHNNLTSNHFFHVSICLSNTDEYRITRLLVDNDSSQFVNLCHGVDETQTNSYFFETDWKERAPCPTCRHGSVCGTDLCCNCSSSWTGCDCSTPVCSPPCQAPATCGAPNTCFPVLQTSLSHATFNMVSGAAFEQDEFITSYSPFPGPRFGASLCRSNGILVMYGGYAVDVTRASPYIILSDMWAYNTNTNIWTWMSGAYSASPVYPLFKGTSSRTATPGRRARAITWAPNTLEMYMFGGDTGTAYNNELWKYNFLSESWTWMEGSMDPSASLPPLYPASLKYDSYAIFQGDLWIYGGESTNASEVSLTNDLWRYSPATDEWTLYNSKADKIMPYYKALLWITPDYVWIYGGDYDLSGHPPLFTTLFRYNVSEPPIQSVTSYAAANYPTSVNTTCDQCNPGPRFGSATWSTADNLYLFGGAFVGDDEKQAQNRYNDVWRYDLMDGHWYWMAGDQNAKPEGSSLTQGEPFLLTSPSSVFAASSNQLWVYGGLGDAKHIQQDMFTYNMRENKWDQQVSPPIYSSIPQYPAFPSGLGTRHPGNLQDVNLQLVDSELYIIGGVHNTYLNGSVFSPAIWSYDTLSANFTYRMINGWERQTSNPVVWHCMGYLYMFGGIVLQGFTSELYRMKANASTLTYLGGGPLTASNYSGGTVWPGASGHNFGWVSGTTLWMFGGLGHASDPAQRGILGDVWRYETTEGKWYFVSGEKHINSLDYFERGIRPGGRLKGAAASNETHMWYYSGVGLQDSGPQLLSQLWQYSIVDDSWLVVFNSSNSTGAFPSNPGQAGTSDMTYPAARLEGGAMYLNGSFYLYGGVSSSGSTWGDLWEFDLARKMWFWLGGSNELGFASRSSVHDVPNSRSLFGCTGSSSGLWIYGGAHQESAANSMDLSDLWYIHIDKDAPAGFTTATIATATTSIASSTSTSTSTTGGTTPPTNPCDSKNGGCDYSVTCQNQGGTPSCGPCPGGTYLNGSACQSLCGDGQCNGTLFEDCVSCPQDCKNATCGKCGDSMCTNSAGENCETCFVDCGPCVKPECKCTKHGTCDLNGHCLCDVGWFGPTCSENSNQPIEVIVNATSPGVNVGTSKSTNFTISIKTLAEVYQDTTYHSEDVQDVEFRLVEVPTGNKNKNHNYSAILENGASLNITFWEFKEPTTTLVSAGVTTIFQAETVKLSVRVENWQFMSLAHSLAIVFETGSLNQENCVNSQANSNNSVQWLMLLDKAVLDGRVRTVSYSLSDSSVTAIIPHFWGYADMDPHFSVLLGDNNKGRCNNKHSSSVDSKIVEIVVPIVVALALLVVLAFVFGPRIKSSMKIWRHEQVSSKSEMTMNELGSSGNEEVLIGKKEVSVEKLDYMETRTAVGTFHVKL